MSHTFTIAIQEAHITELRRQNEALLKENERLKQELAAWPRRAMEHALEARGREKKLQKSKKKR